VTCRRNLAHRPADIDTAGCGAGRIALEGLVQRPTVSRVKVEVRPEVREFLGEVNPSPDMLISLPIYQMALVVYGVHLLENLKLDELATKGVSEFAFVMQPLKLQGATGSTVAPAAIR
jgi:hypothetical protein